MREGLVHAALCRRCLPSFGLGGVEGAVLGRPPPSQLLASPPPWAAGAEHVREGGDSAAPGCHQEEGQPLRRRPRLGAEQHPRQGHRQSHRWAPLGMSCGVGGAISSPVLGLLGLLGLLGAFLAASGTEGPSWCWARVLSPLWTSPLPPFDRPRAARGRSGTSSVALPSCTARSWWRMAACLSARPDTLSWLAVPRWERAGGTPPAALGRAAAPPPQPPSTLFFALFAAAGCHQLHRGRLYSHEPSYHQPDAPQRGR